MRAAQRRLPRAGRSEQAEVLGVYPRVCRRCVGPYFVECQRSRENENTERDHSFVDDMKAMMQLCGAILKPREHGDLCCAELQFAQRCRTLSKESLEKEIWHNNRRQSLQKSETRGCSVCDGLSISLQHIWAVRMNQSNSSVWNAQQKIRVR